MIGTNTHQDCTDFDRDAEIWVVGFRERLMACARSGGQIRVSGALVRVADTSVLKRPLRCTDFGQNAEILGRRVPRATAVREALRWLAKPTCRRSSGKSVLIFPRPTGHSFGHSRDKWTNTTIGLTNATQDKTATQVRCPAAPTPGCWDPSRARYCERRSALWSAIRFTVTTLCRPPQ